MRTGVSYMGHHNPKHLKTDLQEMKEIGLDDVLVAAQENDFAHFVGKINFTPKLAKDLGIRPIAIFWGALNLFGGGGSSQFLLQHPEGFQVAADGAHRPQGCYVNPLCVGRIKEMIDVIAQASFEGYFIDEPTVLRDCYCRSCRDRYAERYAGDLVKADDARKTEFRRRCVIEYIRDIADYCHANHPQLETSCCVMPHDRAMWPQAAGLKNLDNLGTDIYLVNRDNDLESAMTPAIRELDGICKANGKIHHEWLQCWFAKKGREDRILQQGKILVRERPDSIYAWAWHAQIGTTETSEDPELAWAKAVQVFRLAKE